MGLATAGGVAAESPLALAIAGGMLVAAVLIIYRMLTRSRIHRSSSVQAVSGPRQSDSGDPSGEDAPRVIGGLPLGWGIAILIVLFLVWWFVIPAAEGWHLSCNALAGDTQRMVRFGLAWCK